MKIITVLLFVLLKLSCRYKVDLEHVRKHWWAYAEGFKIGKGDIVIFDQQEKLFELKGDTIYYEGTPRAFVVKLNKKDYSMTTESMDRKERGLYYDFDEPRH